MTECTNKNHVGVYMDYLDWYNVHYRYIMIPGTYRYILDNGSILCFPT